MSSEPESLSINDTRIPLEQKTSGDRFVLVTSFVIPFRSLESRLNVPTEGASVPKGFHVVGPGEVFWHQQKTDKISIVSSQSCIMYGRHWEALLKVYRIKSPIKNGGV